MDARLRILSGPHAGETIAVPSSKLLVGREEDCHLRPESEFVSRHHCVLLLDEYTLRVRDLGSKNGTFVNGRRIGIGETILLHDDMVSIGEMICQIDLSGAVPVEDLDVAAMQGTAFFDGETLQTQAPVTARPTVPSPPDSPLPVPAPALYDNDAESTGDTQTLHPAG